MRVIPVPDLKKDKALQALKNYRKRYFNEDPSSEILEKVYEKVGGRLTFLNRLSKSQDMLQTCDEICNEEKTWFLNQCGILGEPMDDDVMDSQKYAVSDLIFVYLCYNLILIFCESLQQWSSHRHL